MTMILKPQLNEMTVRQEGAKILLLFNGRLVCELTWEAAEVVARAMHVQAKKAEEIAKAEQIIYDQAILTRTGFPLGLSNHPGILQEARKEAAWNSDLRRYIPPARAFGIQSQEVFGAPVIRQAVPNAKGVDHV